MNPDSAVDDILTDDLSRVAEYFAVVGCEPGNAVPTPQGCIGLAPHLLDIPEPTLPSSSSSSTNNNNNNNNNNNPDTNSTSNNSTTSNSNSSRSSSPSGGSYRFSDSESERTEYRDHDLHNSYDSDDAGDLHDLHDSHSNSSLDSDDEHNPNNSHHPTYCAVNLRNIWRSAIVEIGVIYTDKHESLPDGWEILDNSITGLPNDGSGNLNQGLGYNTNIVYKRRSNSGRPDHITDIFLVYKSVGKVPEGYSMVHKTVTNAYDANLSRGGFAGLYLCYRRNTQWDDEAVLYNAISTISEIIIVNKSKGENVPYPAQMSTTNVNKGTLRGCEVYLGVFKEVPTGLCDVPYESFTVDRYPNDDYADFSLPVNELPMFVFPHGLKLMRSRKADAPMPAFFPFVFTGLTGERIHVACLTFYEELNAEAVEKLKVRHKRIHATFEQELEELRMETFNANGHGHGHGQKKNSKKWGRSASSMILSDKLNASKSKSNLTDADKDKPTKPDPNASATAYGIYAPKCICIVSRYPFYRALRRFLRQLYRISLSAAPAPLERYISYIVKFLPVPKPGGRPFHIHLESPTIEFMEASSGGFSLAPIALAMPPSRSLPPMDFDFNGPFRALSVPNVLNVFSLMLQESQLLFLSSRASLVTEVCETFRALLFPLEWQCCYVPRLPDALSACLDYPGGFILGMHLVQSHGHGTHTSDSNGSGSGNGSGKNTKGQGQGSGQGQGQGQGQGREGIDVDDFLSKLSLQESVHVIDLDTGVVSKAGGFGKLSTSMFRNNSSIPYKFLPSRPLGVLSKKLSDELKRVNMVAGRGDGLQDYDSAFEFAPTPDIQEKLAALGITDQGMNADVVRDAFLCFMADTIGNYTEFIVPPSIGMMNQINDLKRWMDVDKFLAAGESMDGKGAGAGGRRDFLKVLCDTQMFSCLVQQRTESSANDHRLVFFEGVVNRVKSMSVFSDDYDSDDEANNLHPLKSPTKKYSRSLGNSISSSSSSSNGKKHRGSTINVNNDRPVGLVTQLVHEDLGNFLKSNDFTDLNEALPRSLSRFTDESFDDGASSKNTARSRSSTMSVGGSFGGDMEIEAIEDEEISDDEYDRDRRNSRHSEGAFKHSGSREDKGCDADTSVSVSKRAPLQIPGPSADGIDLDASFEKQERYNNRRKGQAMSSERHWSYPSGWPTPLEPSFFIYPQAALPKILVHMRAQAKQQKAQLKRLVLTRSADEMHKTGLNKFFQKDPFETALEVFGAYFLCLPTLVAHCVTGNSGDSKQVPTKRRANREFLRALGALNRIELWSRDSLKLIDEAMWRSLLIAAGRLGGVKMGDVSIALFGCMKANGLNANAVTYGLYTQALASSSASRNSIPSTAVLTDLIYETDDLDSEINDFSDLEQEGHVWRMEKCAGSRARTSSSGAGMIINAANVLNAGSKLMNSARIGGSSERHSISGDPRRNSGRSTSSIKAASSPRSSSAQASPETFVFSPIPKKSPTFSGGVSMWINCHCPKCKRVFLEEEAMAGFRVSPSGLASQLICARCGGDVTRELLVAVYQPDIISESVKAKPPKMEKKESESKLEDVGEEEKENEEGEDEKEEKEDKDEEKEEKKEKEDDTSIYSIGSISGRPGAVFQEGEGHGKVAKIKEVKRYRFSFISPISVRARLERILIQGGERRLGREELRCSSVEDKTTYWNLVWYSTRFGIPVPLVQRCPSKGDRNGDRAKQIWAHEDVVCSSNEIIGYHMTRNKILARGDWRLDSSEPQRVLSGGRRGSDGLGDSRRSSLELSGNKSHGISSVSSSGKEAERLRGLLAGKKTLSSRSLANVKRLMHGAAAFKAPVSPLVDKREDLKFSDDDGLALEWIFVGCNEKELAALKRLKSILCTGIDSGLEGPLKVEEDDDKISTIRESDSFESVRPSMISAPKLAIPAKRMYDSIYLFCKFRNHGHFRNLKDFPPLSNVYRVLMLICAHFQAEGLGVMLNNNSEDLRGAGSGAGVGAGEKHSVRQAERVSPRNSTLSSAQGQGDNSSNGRASSHAAAAAAQSPTGDRDKDGFSATYYANLSEFDSDYIKAISRLTLMQQDQLDQTDRDLLADVTQYRGLQFRMVFGIL